jgi:hypothetical protein
VANYDAPTSTYDSGLTYADAVPTFNKIMAKVKLNLFNLTDAQLILKAKDVKTKLTGNANFTTTVPSLTDFGTLITAADTALAASDAANATANEKTLAKNNAVDALRKSFGLLGTNIESLAGGAADKILSAGLDTRATKTPAGVPVQVANLSVSAGDHDGELNSQWDPVPGAKTYEVQTSPDPFTASSWSKTKSVTKSLVVLTGFTSGSRIWVRVRAIGAGGEGNYSSEISKIVP